MLAVVIAKSSNTHNLLTYGMLYGWREEWEQGEAILYVTISQVDAGACMRGACMMCVRYVHGSM